MAFTSAAFEPAVAQGVHVGRSGRDVAVVRDHHEGRTGFRHLFGEEREDRLAGRGIEVAGGSSASINFGCATSARAIAARCSSPPDSSPGRCAAR